MHNENGLSLATKWHLTDSRPVNFTDLSRNQDAHWQECITPPFSDFRKAAQKVRMFIPRGGQATGHARADHWLCFRNGEKFTQSSLGYVADTFVQLVELLTHTGRDPYVTASAEIARYWYPTLSLSLDVKKLLPENGVDWVFVRVEAKQIRNGRYDLEVVIMDVEGDVVALSHHVCMVLSAERNLVRSGKSKL